MRRDVAARDLDLAAAVAAGPAYWGWRSAAGAELAAMLTAAALAAAVAGSASAGALAMATGGLPKGLLVLGVWCAVATWVAVGAWIGVASRSLVLTAMLRVAAITVLVGLWGAAHDGDMRLLEMWPLGAAIGLDAFVTLRTLGVPVDPRRAVPAVVASGGHAGIVLALVVVASPAAGWVAPRQALALYVGIVVNVVLALLATYGAMAVSRAVDRDEAAHRAEEARRRANWIHDEVCSLLIPLRQSVRSGLLTDTREIAAQLDDIDFELRHVQLEQTARHGSISLADLVQVWGRRVQAAGIELVAPPWEVTRAALPETARHRASRLLGVAVPNAIAAKAGRITIEADREVGGGIRLAVVDDAGGFDVDQLPPRRGLHRLLTELGDDVHVERLDDGTRVSARLPEVG
jgi:hypothetical protein